MTGALYAVRNLTVEYATRSGTVHAVDDVSFDIRQGEIMGLVGESGCGKSTLGKALMRMIEPPGRIAGGQLIFDSRDLMTLSAREMRTVRGGQIGMVFQDPMTSLNPVQRIVDHLTETILTHEPATTKQEARRRAEDLAELLGIRRERIDDYPHQFSGGMRQRVMIALALALRAKLVIADEPTTSLDVIVEAKFLDLLRELRAEFDLTILLITHNIGIVAEIADRVAVMYAGRMVELGDAEDVFAEPRHPYTRDLLRSVPNTDLDDTELYQMAGSPPSLLQSFPGCPYAPRCPDVMDVCRAARPDFVDTEAEDHPVACWLGREVPVAG